MFSYNYMDYGKKNLVHGDVRTYNIIFGEKSSLIDFDFCGLAGKRFYPKGFNQSISDTLRHKDAKPGNVLQIEHDIFSFQSILKRFEPKTENPDIIELWENLVKFGMDDFKSIIEKVSKFSKLLSTTTVYEKPDIQIGSKRKRIDSNCTVDDAPSAKKSCFSKLPS